MNAFSDLTSCTIFLILSVKKNEIIIHLLNYSLNIDFSFIFFLNATLCLTFPFRKFRCWNTHSLMKTKCSAKLKIICDQKLLIAGCFKCFHCSLGKCQGYYCLVHVIDSKRKKNIIVIHTYQSTCSSEYFLVLRLRKCEILSLMSCQTLQLV